MPSNIYNDQLLENLIDHYSIICKKKLPLVKNIPYALSTLLKLNKYNKSLFISSATPKKYLIELVEIRNLKKYFKGIYGSPKSKYDHILQILSLTKSKKNKIIYIGDSEIDLQSAKKVGCDFIAIGKDKSRFISNPKILIDNYKDFFNYIKL